MSNCGRRQLVLWVLLTGLPLAALGNARRSEAPRPDSPRNLRLDSAAEPLAERAYGRELEPPARLPPIPINQQSWFVSAERQLRAQGVTYMRLEKWHGRQAVYYFECRMRPNDRRERRVGTMPLTSLSVSPQAAMQDVLRRTAAAGPPAGPLRAAIDHPHSGAATTHGR